MGLKRTMDNEKNENLTEYDLSKDEDRKKLAEQFTNNDFFDLSPDVTYKVSLTNTKVTEVIRINDNGKEYSKYSMSIKAKGSDGTAYEGEWQAPKSVMKEIFAKWEPNAIFNLSKKGEGLDTRYSVVKDF